MCNRHSKTRRGKRSGMALLLCLFVITIVTVWLVDMLNSEAVYQSALRNAIEFEQALYLANAGVHHTLAELEGGATLPFNVPSGGSSPPAAGSYYASAVDGGGGQVVITSEGRAGEVTRRVEATIQ